MTDKELDNLLDRFASGEISGSEQQSLIDQINSHPLPELPEGLEQRLSETIDTFAEAEHTREAITVATRKKTSWHILTGIAASVAVVIAIGVHLFTTPATMPPTPLDTCATPEEAYIEAQKALLIFSSALDKGMQQIEMVQTTTDNIHNKVMQQLKKV